MTCKCIEEVDAMLNEQQGGQLDISIFYRSGKHSLEARPSLYINRRDTGRKESRSGRAKVLTPTFCPFCGERYIPNPEAEQAA